MQKKTRQQKQRAGTYRKDKDNGQLSDFAPINIIPPAPGWLSEEGRAVYERITQDRLKAGLLFEADIDLFVAYAREASTYTQMCEDIANEGEIVEDKNKDPRRNPKILIASKALENAMKLAKQLGIGVYGRDKIASEAPEKKENPSYIDIQLAIQKIARSDDFKRMTKEFTRQEVDVLKYAIEDVTILDKKPEFGHLREPAAYFRGKMGFDEWAARYGEI